MGGGADLSGFFLWGIFSLAGFDVAEAQPNNHSSDRGGGPSPKHPGICEELSQRMGEGGGRLASIVSYTDDLCGIGSKGKMVVFTVVTPFPQLGLRVCVLLFIYFLLFKPFSWSLSQSAVFFPSVVAPFLFSLPFYCVGKSGRMLLLRVSPRTSNQLHSMLLTAHSVHTVITFVAITIIVIITVNANAIIFNRQPCIDRSIHLSFKTR